MKTLNVSTLETRFNKIHTAANFAEDCMRAILMHAGRIVESSLSFRLDELYAELNDSVNEWVDELSKFASLCQSVESQYYNNLIDNNTKCVLIEPIPTYSNKEIPSPFEMSETMFQIGYYTLDEDFYGVKGKEFSYEEISEDITKLRDYIGFCVKALANMTCTGIWEPVGKKTCEIHDMFCEGPSSKISVLLDAYKSEFDKNVG